MQKTAFITGITGQDGAYLAELLLKKGYRVVGLQRRCSSVNTFRIDHILNDIELLYGDMGDASGLIKHVAAIKPDEIYNLAAQSHVGISFEAPEYTGNIDGLGAVRLLEAIRIAGLKKTTRFVQASTSELYGAVNTPTQNEETPFSPRSPYAAAKLYAYWMTVNYREAYGMHTGNAIMFNHESPIRGEDFVTHKITKAVAEISTGVKTTLSLGNLDAKRDWGHANDYVEGMWRMMQQDAPNDFVFATGQTKTVRSCVEVAFAQAGITITWQGSGIDEKGINQKTGQVLINIDPAFFRPTEVDQLCGDASKAKEILGWQPTIPFETMIAEMVQWDLNNLGVTKPSKVA